MKSNLANSTGNDHSGVGFTSMQARHAPLAIFRFALILALLCALASTSRAQTLTTLHSFSGAPDGSVPDSALAFDPDANVYGATFSGGSSTACQGGCGTVFKIATDGTESVLYSFAGNNDGANPNFLGFYQGQLVGTTLMGGLNGHKAHKVFGFGTIFLLSLTGQESIFNNFTGGVHAYPQGLTILPSGNLIGTTAGVSLVKANKRYNGSVFNQITKNDHAILKFMGSNSAAGAFPTGGLASDSQGNVFGTTMSGGSSEGVAFEVTPNGVETLLHTFTGADGAVPAGGLIRDAQGNLYGVTAYGGQFFQGTVFEITSSGFSTLHSFSGSDGADPQSLLIFDAQGNLYGTTYSGGAYNQGVVFELSPSGNETVLYSFTGGIDGAHPQAALVFDSQGNLYGTTATGGTSGVGTVFKLAP